MKKGAARVDLLHGPLTGSLLRFTLPIALGSILQQLFNAADTAVVGLCGERDALAAVGTNTEIVALIVTLSAGLAVGANVLIAELIGRGDEDALPSAVRTAGLLFLGIGLFGAAAGQWLVRQLLGLIRTPAGIFSAASRHLRIYLLGYSALLLYDLGAAVLRARGDSRYPFLALTAAGAVNVVLDLFFVAGLHLGVEGVAIATGLSTALSALLVLRRVGKDPLFRSPGRRTPLSGRALRQILRQRLLLSTVCSSVPIFAVVLLRVPLSGLFTKDPAVVHAACVRILGILLFEPLCNLYEIPAGVLRGSGHALYPAAAAVVGTCVFRIVWIFTVFRTHPTLPVLYRASPLSWAATIVLTGIGLFAFYRAGGRAGNSR